MNNSRLLDIPSLGLYLGSDDEGRGYLAPSVDMNFKVQAFFNINYYSRFVRAAKKGNSPALSCTLIGHVLYHKTVTSKSKNFKSHRISLGLGCINKSGERVDSELNIFCQNSTDLIQASNIIKEVEKKEIICGVTCRYDRINYLNCNFFCLLEYIDNKDELTMNNPRIIIVKNEYGDKDE